MWVMLSLRGESQGEGEFDAQMHRHGLALFDVGCWMFVGLSSGHFSVSVFQLVSISAFQLVSISAF
jgi:hypothetical protein